MVIWAVVLDTWFSFAFTKYKKGCHSCLLQFTNELLKTCYGKSYYNKQRILHAMLRLSCSWLNYNLPHSLVNSHLCSCGSAEVDTFFWFVRIKTRKDELFYQICHAPFTINKLLSWNDHWSSEQTSWSFCKYMYITVADRFWFLSQRCRSQA